MHHLRKEEEEEMCAPTPSFPHAHHHCLHCHPARYIRLVQHLIEKCLTFHMDRDDCVRALAKHASIQPIVTITVWDELLKENPGFFHSYFEALRRRSMRTPLPNTTTRCTRSSEDLA